MVFTSTAPNPEGIHRRYKSTNPVGGHPRMADLQFHRRTNRIACYPLTIGGEKYYDSTEVSQRLGHRIGKKSNIPDIKFIGRLLQAIADLNTT